jgi:hypothetical protein
MVYILELIAQTLLSMPYLNTKGIQFAHRRFFVDRWRVECIFFLNVMWMGIQRASPWCLNHNKEQ